MALNIATFKTRTLSAVVFVLIMGAGLLWNQWSFFLLFTVIHFGCWTEYQRLVGAIDPEYAGITPFHRYGVMIAGWCIMLYLTNDAFRIGDLSLHAVGWWTGLVFVFVLPLAEILFTRELSWKNIGYSALGLLYISLSLALFTNIRCLFHGGPFPWMEKMPVLMIIGSIWINDTMAYIVGSLIGRTPFSSISPKKTWEGTIGGVLLAVLAMGAIGYGVGYHYSQLTVFSWEGLKDWMAIAAIAAITGTAGDLLESKLKRMAGVKDSGSIMPGHGGFLDRFDSLLIAVPFCWIYIILFLR